MESVLFLLELGVSPDDEMLRNTVEYKEHFNIFWKYSNRIAVGSVINTALAEGKKHFAGAFGESENQSVHFIIMFEEYMRLLNIKGKPKKVRFLYIIVDKYGEIVYNLKHILMNCV